MTSQKFSGVLRAGVRVMALASVISPLFLFTPYFFNNSFTLPVVYAAVFAAAACVAAAVMLISGAGAPPVVNRYGMILLALAAWTAVSGAGNPGINRMLYADRLWALAAVFALAVTAAAGSGESFFRKLAALVTLAASVVFIYGAAQEASFYAGFRLFLTEDRFGHRLFSLLGNPDVCAAFCVAAAPLIAFCFSVSRNPVHAVLLALDMGAVVLTGSFSGMAVTALMGFTAAFIVFRGKKARIALTIAACLAVAAGFFMAGTKSGSLYIRKLLAESAAAMMEEKPVAGFGAGNYLTQSPKYMGKALQKGGYPAGVQAHDEAYAHNDYLQAASETGVPGLLLFMLAVFYPFYYSARRPDKANAFALFSLGGTALFAIVNFPFQAPVTAGIYFITAAWLTRDDNIPAGVGLKLPAAIGYIAISAALLFPVGGYLTRNYLIQFYNYSINRSIRIFPEAARKVVESDYQLCFLAGIAMNRETRYFEAEDYFSKALKLYPYFSGARFNMGNSYMNSGDLDRAAECYADVISWVRDFGPAYNNLGIILMKQNQYDKAISVLSEGEKYKPDMFEIKMNLAKALYFKGQYQDALIEVMKAIQLQKNDKDALSLLNQISKAVGK